MPAKKAKKKKARIADEAKEEEEEEVSLGLLKCQGRKIQDRHS